MSVHPLFMQLLIPRGRDWPVTMTGAGDGACGIARSPLDKPILRSGVP